jgi:hypothetical protein
VMCSKLPCIVFQSHVRVVQSNMRVVKRLLV